jgi:UDP-3-O-[3-hydroxymyristoyl] N-acetylglucosamine deacetylase
MFPFQTLVTPLIAEGVGLHSGARVRVEILPRRERGLVFVRADLPGRVRIPACARHIGSTLHATTLEANGAQISTPEHLLAALWSYGITHAEIVVDGPEIPILDGSAKPWCDLIEAAQIQTLPGVRPEYSLSGAVAVYERDGCVVGLPHRRFRVTTDVEYEVEYLEAQIAACDVTAQSFCDELAAARTFTLEKWIEPLRAQSLIRGGTMENALVLGEAAPFSPLRFPNELARHKAMDVIGDISLLFGENGGVLRAHLIAVRAGHGLHQRWMQEVLRTQALTQVH